MRDFASQSELFFGLYAGVNVSVGFLKNSPSMIGWLWGLLIVSMFSHSSSHCSGW